MQSAKTFYRAAFDRKANGEDGCFANEPSKLYGVTDGNSAAFSPSNPQDKYPGGLTGGQMVIRQVTEFLEGLVSFVRIKKCLVEINERILRQHQLIGKDPTKGHDVGGASFAFCQLDEQGVKLLLGGDCFVLIKLRDRCLFLTGFDQPAFALEEADQDAYNACLQQTKSLDRPNGSIGAAWDLYFSHYRQKRLRCKNKNIGQGGHADLNGDPALSQCWLWYPIAWRYNIEKIFLATDGFLPPSQFNGQNLNQLGETLWSISNGDPEKILSWRDSQEARAKRLRHVEGWPEAAAVILDFQEPK